MLLLKPNRMILLAFAGVASATQQLQVARVIRPAVGDGYNVVDFELIESEAGGAPAVLPLEQGGDVVTAHPTTHGFFLCASVLFAGASNSLRSFRVSGLPRLDVVPCLLWVLGAALALVGADVVTVSLSPEFIGSALLLFVAGSGFLYLLAMFFRVSQTPSFGRGASLLDTVRVIGRLPSFVLSALVRMISEPTRGTGTAFPLKLRIDGAAHRDVGFILNLGALATLRGLRVSFGDMAMLTRRAVEVSWEALFGCFRSCNTFNQLNPLGEIRL